jgi:hypothetical protein
MKILHVLFITLPCQFERGIQYLKARDGIDAVHVPVLCTTEVRWKFRLQFRLSNTRNKQYRNTLAPSCNELVKRVGWGLHVISPLPLSDLLLPARLVLVKASETWFLTQHNP